ncbi:hypothetical protein GCM10022297_05140 [Lactobacillus hamsteri]|uniref:Rpn family recombination-promoting nuclease/putative transposase n=1 Tax=Lactobacillus hamsteri DSM 5661 = JCM 6256 TaxID=1423754 RepID=A0A0R1YFE5_9LACO|nr:Rpn family recombination-promoting nuclease/putative transposase [Lactobacillus hamsteri]KRM41216.1 hypothetical protein FC39_GL001227 [Lactobacillus hamsteri DSM 5661 = JCM 6256]
MKKQEWFGFTEDKVFGWVMEDKEFCKYILQIILPEIKIKRIDWLEKQKELNDYHRDQKDVRLDILVEDEDHRLYDVEMQVSNKHDLGARMRYYLSKMDSEYSLGKGKTYHDLKEAYIIFLCPFDPEGEGLLKYSAHTYLDQNRAKRLNDGSHKVIINSKGSFKGISTDLQGLARLMNNEPVKLNKHFDYAQSKIREINDDPEKRSIIMEYETKMLERERDAEEIGMQKGMQEGMKEGMQEGMRQGVTKGTIETVKKDIKSYRKFGIPDDQILEELITNFSDIISVVKLKQLMKD